MPCADAKPTPAISATVPINIIFTLRLIGVPLWSLFHDGSAVTFGQEETGARAVAFPGDGICFAQPGLRDDHKMASESEITTTQFEFR
jgi:hypothetical protein